MFVEVVLKKCDGLIIDEETDEPALIGTGEFHCDNLLCYGSISYCLNCSKGALKKIKPHIKLCPSCEDQMWHYGLQD